MTTPGGTGDAGGSPALLEGRMATEVKPVKGQTLSIMGDDYEFITGGPLPEGYSAGAGEVVRLSVHGKFEPRSFSFLATEKGADSDVASLFRALAGAKVYSSWTCDGGPVVMYKMTITGKAQKAGYHVATSVGHVCFRRRKSNAERIAKAVGGKVHRGTGKAEKTTLPVRMASTSVDGSTVSVGFSVVGAITRE